MAATTFPLRVISTYGTFFDGDCVGVSLPCPDGRRGILARHEDCIVSVIPGTMKITLPDGTESLVVVTAGYAHIDRGVLTLIVDTAERPEDIDRLRAEEARQRAEEELSRQQNRLEYEQSKASLARAMARLKATQK